MKYAYPAIFTPVENGEFDVKIPDLPGCRTCGHGLADAIYMAEDAVSMWLWDAETKAEPIPTPTSLPTVDAPQFANYIVADTDEYRRKNDSRAVKRTVSIPKWMDDKVAEAGLSLSRVLQDALKDRLNVE